MEFLLLLFLVFEVFIQVFSDGIRFVRTVLIQLSQKGIYLFSILIAEMLFSEEFYIVLLQYLILQMSDYTVWQYVSQYKIAEQIKHHLQNYSMQVSSVPLYYSHITSGIDKFQSRKDKYIYHRLKFLKEYCQPVQHKIEQVKQQIKLTKQLLKNQDILIDTQKDIAIMLSHMKQYEQTKNYYLMHIDQYEQKYLELKTRNDKLRRWIRSAKSQISDLSRDQFKNVEQIIREQDSSFQQSLNKELLKPKVSSSLPPLINPPKNYNHRVVQKIKQRLQKSSIQLQNSKVSYSKELQRSQIANPESLKTIQQRITEFDQTQSLFKQCFDKKKHQVQRSVSQLQAKLIQNKEIFLKVCQAVGEKTGKVTEQQFIQLTGDEIVTLFISFGWLGRKLGFQFANKRKQIIQYIKKRNQHKKLSLKQRN